MFLKFFCTDFRVLLKDGAVKTKQLRVSAKGKYSIHGWKYVNHPQLESTVIKSDGTNYSLHLTAKNQDSM